MIQYYSNKLKRITKCVNKIVRARENYGMELYIKKTKEMVAMTIYTGVINVVVKRMKLEQVEEYKYLGSWVMIER